MYTRACLVALAFTVAGCATMGGYQPTVDPFNDPYAGRIPHDEAECRELALQSSGGTAKESAIGAAVGGLPGPARGAPIGAAPRAPRARAPLGAAPRRARRRARPGACPPARRAATLSRLPCAGRPP